MRRMKSRFPADLSKLLSGPVLVLVVALLIGALIFRARSDVLPVAIAAVILIVAVPFWLFVRRRRRGR
jgi:hypothetical protein